MIVPTKDEFVPNEEPELGTVQKTLQAWAPPVKTTLLPGAVTRSDEAWKMYIPSPIKS